LHLQSIYQFRNRTTWAVEGEAKLVAMEMGGVNNTEHIGVFDFGTTSAGDGDGDAGGAGNSDGGGGNGAVGAPGDAISRFALLTDASRMPTVHITNSYFGQNRARGALLAQLLTSALLFCSSWHHHEAAHVRISQHVGLKHMCR
jgi:hypothetical protein